jgi:aryl-alcohol dehydrogenase-like predicted oxidoreductase
MTLGALRTLGRSGLVVSPLALGTMTFGTPGWGSTDDASEAIFEAYVEAGGNFIDTADVYAGGRSEALLGGFIAERGLRDRLVLATKFGFHGGAPGDPHGGGNGRKNLHRALEGSLRRLRTDCIDLYWLHVWDAVTPVEEVLQSLGDLVRAGKIRHFGFSNVPAWFAAKACTLAAAHGVPGPIALQLAYSLVERDIESEHVPAAREGGLGLVAWSPLAAGLLAGKYRREGEGVAASGGGRLLGPNPFGSSLFTERNWRVLEALRAVAAELGRPMSQVALAWAAAQPGVGALVVGASRLAQLHDNLASAELVLGPEALRVLGEIGAPPPRYPYGLFAPEVNRGVFGGATVAPWR